MPTISRRLGPFVLGGLIAGSLDILYAFALAAQAGRPPLRVLNAIASGVLGKAAFDGGSLVALSGLLLHFLILLFVAYVCAEIARMRPMLARHWVVAGIGLGVLVYLVMNFVVLPLSAVPFKINHTPWTLLQGFVSHAVLVGLPIAWSARPRQ